MLDFLDYLANHLKSETDGNRYWRTVSLNSEDCRYLLIMQNHQKTFQLDSDVYTGLLNFFGTEGLKTFANYAKRHYEKYSGENKEHAEYILAEIAKSCGQKSKFEGWMTLYKLLNSEQWNSTVNKNLDINYALSIFLRLAIRKEEQTFNKIFEKRLNLLCETLNLDNVNRDILRYFS